jgi:hypothetical protein
MLGDVRQLIAKVERLRTLVSKHKKQQVQSAQIPSAVKDIVDEYFRQIRPNAVAISPNETDVVDRCMQDMLALTHSRTATTRYKVSVDAVRTSLRAIEQRALLASAPSAAAGEPIDLRLLAVLRPLLPSAAASYEQAILDLRVQHRLSWRGPATDLRESLRELLDHLAPDVDVISQPGYKQESGTSGPTMKQKVRFILRKRGISGAADNTSEAAANSIDEAIGTFVRSVYTRSSVSTHTPTNKVEVLRVRDLVRVVLCELLEVQT